MCAVNWDFFSFLLAQKKSDLDTPYRCYKLLEFFKVTQGIKKQSDLYQRRKIILLYGVEKIIIIELFILLGGGDYVTSEFNLQMV